MNPIFVIIASLILTALLHIIWEQYKSLKKYRPIINIDKTIKEKNIQKDQLIKQIKELRTAYINLKKEHSIYYDDIEMISYGHYTPYYDFADFYIL